MQRDHMRNVNLSNNNTEVQELIATVIIDYYAFEPINVPAITGMKIKVHSTYEYSKNY